MSNESNDNPTSELPTSSAPPTDQAPALDSASSDALHADDRRYLDALQSVRHTLDRFRGCSEQEKELLRRDLSQLQTMETKLTSGRVEIVVFGEISTGKSALINALVGKAVTQVDIQGGWTKEVWHVAWDGAGYRIPGLADSEVVLIDTPGINEVGGADRGEMAQDTARQADVILFVIDSDLNETEYSALVALASVNKPIIVVLNKIDLYSPRERERLDEILEQRLSGIIAKESIVETSAQPKEVEYIIQQADGTERSEWRNPPAKVEDLKLRLLEVLEEDGLGLLALNAAMYAADKSDRVASLKVKIRDHRANQTIWSFAVVKATAVAVNPLPVYDVIGGSAVDVAMLRALAHIYGIEMTWSNIEKLVTSILQAAGWAITAELGTHAISSVVKTLTLGWGTVLTALPQGGAAGYGSYIVGKAAKYYFEHGASWGDEGPKTVVKRILEETDKKSVVQGLKDEIQKKLHLNRHASGGNEARR
ncbi:GTP-binding protein [Bremerella sp. JC817]|uniref:YcjF family protein n=1 Tax=Bremerella sp. JC817 TaxID=3231756 RepID=UPI003459D192